MRASQFNDMSVEGTVWRDIGHVEHGHVDIGHGKTVMCGRMEWLVVCM